MKFILFFILMSASVLQNAFAVDVVYRGDFRAPEVIFESGFQSRGDNQEILLHIIGDSGRNNTDAFISTTASFDSVRQIASDILLPASVDDTWWIYAIIPSNNFYDMNNSLVVAAANTSIPLELNRQAYGLYMTFGWQNEVAALRNIPRNQIIYAQEARRVTNNDGTEEVIISENRRYNPHYTQSNPSINPSFITPIHSITDFPVDYYGDLNRNPTQVSFDIEGCNIMRSEIQRCKQVSYSSIKKLTIAKILVTLDGQSTSNSDSEHDEL
ncbi:TPA: hypothetical protein KV183_003435 [Morganella morganii]|nr:hypothetical protein [Morganella morganii]HEI9846869.1 hypothetical protein [Morganella morganii]